MFSTLFISFAEHPWIQQYAQQTQAANSHHHHHHHHHHQTDLCFGQEDLGSCSFSSFSDPIARRSHDFSFGFSPPANSDAMASSSSPLQADTTTTAAAGFSFPLLPSFSFFSPPPNHHQENILNLSSNNTKGNTIQRESSFGDLFDKEAKGPAATTSRAAVGLRSKRNHTIGVCEIEQLDLVVSESVIRWSSCTHPAGTASLRSSLVC